MIQIQQTNPGVLAEVQHQITTVEEQIKKVSQQIEYFRGQIALSEKNLADARAQIAQERLCFTNSKRIAPLQKDIAELNATFEKEKKEHNLLVTRTKNGIHLLQQAIHIPGINLTYVKITPSPYAAACVYV